MPKTSPAALALAMLVALPSARLVAAEEPLARHAFTLAEDAEVTAQIQAACPGCAWGATGREAAALRLEVDGRYSQHLLLVRGEGPAAYRVSLGPLSKGDHAVVVALDAAWTPEAARRARIARIATEAVPGRDPRHALVAHAPIVCARENAIRRFTDLPLVAWVEQDERPEGRRLRYSVVFSNEDGGTPADRLLATWGRLTDIEYVYGVELDRAGRAAAAEFQGKDHEIRAFAGRREGLHPLLTVVTDNNMVADAGPCDVRFAPVAQPFDLTGVSREAVMDAEPWTYRVSSEEARREGRVAPGARPGDETIADPGRYAYLEACAETKDVGLTFAVGVAGGDGSLTFHESDGGLGKFLILRSADHFPNGCFRGAVALPSGTPPSAIRALRFRARTRPARKDEPPLPAGAGAARLLRVNKLFLLGPGDEPGPSLLSWKGDLTLIPEGPAVSIEIGG